MNFDDIFGEPIEFNPDWKNLDVDKILSEFVCKHLYGHIKSTGEQIRCFYSAFNNRQPINGDIVFDDMGNKVFIIEIDKDEYVFEYIV